MSKFEFILYLEKKVCLIFDDKFCQIKDQKNWN